MSIVKKQKSCKDSSLPVQCSEVREGRKKQDRRPRRSDEENQDSGALKGK